MVEISKKLMRNKKGIVPAVLAVLILAGAVGVPVFIGFMKAVLGGGSGVNNPPWWIILALILGILVLFKK